MIKVFKTRSQAEEAAKQESDGLLGSKGFSCVAKKNAAGWIVQVYDERNRGRFAGHLHDTPFYA